MGKYTIRQWHQKRPGWTISQYGRIHISGGSGLRPLHSYTPSTASQNLAHEVLFTAPPRACIKARARTQYGSEAASPSSRAAT